MEKKLCQSCRSRKKDGYCTTTETFVPRKKVKGGKQDGLCIATTCDYFKPKKV